MEVIVAYIEVTFTSMEVIVFGIDCSSMEVDRTEARGPLWNSSESNWKRAILVHVGGGM